MKKVNCILLIDDNPADNLYHKIQIDKSGLCQHVKVALDGEAALAYIQNASEGTDPENYPMPDMIFLDINMPKINGFEFLEGCKKAEYQLNLIIVMLTTSLNPDDQERAQSYKEVKEFQNKPLTVQMLTQLVEKYFN